MLCIASRGMSFIGLDEIFVAYYCNVQSVELPVDCLWRVKSRFLVKFFFGCDGFV